MRSYDWNKPQRQPLAGLAVVFLNTFWQIAKRLWPLLLVALLGNKEGKANSYEIMAIVFLSITIISALIRFFFFRFYIEGDKLIIKSGSLVKLTKSIPLQKIQTVHIEQGPVHQLLNIVKLSIDTAGSQKAEARIDALHQSMAEALRLRLLSEKAESTAEEKPQAAIREPVIRLSGKDLIKLSISANHVEAFFILLSFIFGLYENLKDINTSIFSGLKDLMPEGSFYPVLFLTIAILFITILVSTAKIFFSFYDFTIYRTLKGFQIRSGLLNVKERLVAFQKIQFISWRANWIRKLLGLWMLDYHIAGADELKNKLKVQVPVTQTNFLATLVSNYSVLPDTGGQPALRMHRSFIQRRLLIYGVLPFVLIFPFLWWAWHAYSLVLLGYPLLVLTISWCIQKKFRLWASEEVLYVRKGIFGEERILMKWPKLQSARINQSMYQRKKELATIILYTAGGEITIPFIPLPAARQLINFVLYKTESSKESWL